MWDFEDFLTLGLYAPINLTVFFFVKQTIIVIDILLDWIKYMLLLEHFLFVCYMLWSL